MTKPIEESYPTIVIQFKAPNNVPPDMEMTIAEIAMFLAGPLGMITQDQTVNADVAQLATSVESVEDLMKELDDSMEGQWWTNHVRVNLYFVETMTFGILSWVKSKEQRLERALRNFYECGLVGAKVESMIDFSEYGNIVFHEPYKDTEYDILEFRPFGGANTRQHKENLAEKWYDSLMWGLSQHKSVESSCTVPANIPFRCIIHPREPEIDNGGRVRMGMAENDPRFDWYEDPQMEEKPDEIIAQEFEDHCRSAVGSQLMRNVQTSFTITMNQSAGDLTIRPELESVISMTLSSIKQHQDRHSKKGVQILLSKWKTNSRTWLRYSIQYAITKQLSDNWWRIRWGITAPRDEAVMMKGSLFKPSPFNW